MEEPPDNAPVVRLGKQSRFVEAAIRDAELALQDEGRADISVFSAAPEPQESETQVIHRICQASATQYKAKWFRVSRADLLRAEGFRPRQDDPELEAHPYHFNIDIGEPTAEAAERLLSLFGQETRNQAWK